MQRARAVDLGRIDVGFVCDQRANGCGVASLDCRNDFGLRARSEGGQSYRQDDE
jgi:hypothetical protein